MTFENVAFTDKQTSSDVQPSLAESVYSPAIVEKKVFDTNPLLGCALGHPRDVCSTPATKLLFALLSGLSFKGKYQHNDGTEILVDPSG